MIKAFLASFALAVPSFARIVLAQLGIGILSFTAMNATFSALLAVAKQNYQSMALDILQIANLAGIGDGLGIIASAVIARVSIQFLPKLGVLPSE